MRKVLIFAFMLTLVFTATVLGQDTIWTRIYGFGDDSELGLCGNVCSDGGYIAGGISYYFPGLSGEFWLVRTDANGDTIWTRNYGGGRWQEAHYVIQTADGGFAVCGGTNVAVGDYDLYVVKTDSLGDTLWTQSYGASAQQDDGQAIIQTSDGGYLAVGSGWNGILSDLMMVRLNGGGDILWTKFYGATYSSDYGYGVVETPDSGFAVTGNYDSGGASNLWLLRTNANGDTLWTRKFDFNNYWDVGNQIVMTSDGGFAIGGRTFLNSSVYRILALRTDSLGNEIWHSQFAGLGLAFGESIDKTSDGGFVVAGGTRADLVGSLDYYIVRVDSMGDSLWAATYDYDGLTGDSEDCYEVKVDADGNIMAFGYADISPSGSDTWYWVLKILDDALVDIDDPDHHVPTDYYLKQNYPNPFNASTIIEYSLPENAYVTLDIYDILGRHVVTLVNGNQTAGRYQVVWDAGRSASGVYFCRIQANDYIGHSSMLLVK